MSSLRRSHRIKKLYHQNLHDSSNSDQENEELEEMDINLSEEEDRSCDEDESDLSDFIVRDEDEDEEDGDYEEESDSSYDSDDELKNKIKTKFKISMNEVIRFIESKYLKQIEEPYDNLSPDEKESIEQIEKEVERINSSYVPNRVKILQSSLNIDLKAQLIKRIDQIESMDPTTNEYHKLKQWIDGFMMIPFGIYKEMEYDNVQTFLSTVKSTLDQAVFGHQEAKDDIIQLVAQWISNPSSVGQVLGIMGAKGVGKTFLVKHGIAKALNRPFCFFSLGGATDGSVLDGYSYTYEGSSWGHLVDMLMKSKCMNPVIFFDELDKVSETKYGQEIIGKLIHLTDFTQNDSIQDKYFAGIPFDFSRALFIFSFNDDTKIDKILMDRIKVIKTQDFSKKDKIQIAKDYIIPELVETVGFKEGEIIISDEIYDYIMTKVPQEKGVRKFKELLRTLFMKINVNRYIHDIPYKICNFQLPLNVTREIVDNLIKSKQNDTTHLSMYM
jgi:ATP-dependent Lon protease